MIRTRHRRIAAAVIEVMQEEFGEDIESFYLELVQAAVKARPNAFIQGYSRWEYDLSGHFLKKQPELAIQIGSILLEQKPNDAKLAVNLARIYRQAKEPAEGARALRATTPLAHGWRAGRWRINCASNRQTMTGPK